MRRLLPVSLAFVAALGVSFASAQAQTSGVRDQAAMFSSETVQKVTRTLRDIERDSGLSVRVETVDSLGGQSVKERAVANVRRMDGRGLYILISKAEHKVEIEPTRAAMKAFPKEENQTLIKRIVDAFKAREFDRGLIAAVDEIQKRAVPTGGVRDGAALFSSEAVAKANRVLREIQQTSKWQVVIETIDSLNGRSKKDVATENLEALRLNGLYILIAKTDRQDYIAPSRAARAIFTSAKIDELVAGIHRSFGAKQFDQGLLDIVEQIRKDFQSTSTTAAAKPALAPTRPATTNNPPSAAAVASTHKPSPAPNSTTPIPPEPVAGAREVVLPPDPVAPAKKSANFLPILVIAGAAFLALIWLFSRALRGGTQPAGGPQGGWQNQVPQTSSGPQPRPNPVPQGYGPQPGFGPQPPPGYAGGAYGPPPRQGGGFMSGLLGGAAGAVAGNILYDQFGRPHPVEGSPPQEHGMPYPQHETGMPPEENNIPDAGAGGDWGSPDDAQANTADDWAGSEGAGGDWGSSEPAAEDGGDWGNDSAPDYGADVDPGSDGGAGGDWGGDAPDADQGQGGGW